MEPFSRATYRDEIRDGRVPLESIIRARWLSRAHRVDAIARPRKAKLEYSRWKHRPGERPLQLLLLLVFDFFSFSRVRGVPSTFYLLSASFPLSLPHSLATHKFIRPVMCAGAASNPTWPAARNKNPPARTYLISLLCAETTGRSNRTERAGGWLWIHKATPIKLDLSSG